MSQVRSAVAEQKSGSAGPTSKQDRVFELEAELDHQRERLEDIKTMGAVIASILEMERALPVMMEMTLRTVNGEVGAILLEEDDELFAKVAWGLDQALLDRLEVEGGLLLKQAYSNGWETLCLNNCDLAPGSGLKVASLLAAPISSHERRHGLTVVLNKERGGEFTQDDLASLQSLNHFLAVAIENARLFEETLEKQRLDQELEIARQVQQTILPDATLSHPGFEIGAVYVAAHQVGGDFYELIPLPDGSFVLIVGDVSNKGVAAALVMSACSGIIKSLLRTDPQMRMCHLAASLNDTLAEGVVKDKGMFATIWFGRFDPGGQGLAYCNAGHLPPLWRAAGNGEITELSAGGPIVGQFEGITFTEGHVQLSAGDSITLFTDGLTEAEDRDGQLFGRERAQAFVEEFTDLAPAEFCREFRRRIETYSAGAAGDTQDDFTALQVRIDPTQAERSDP